MIPIEYVSFRYEKTIIEYYTVGSFESVVPGMEDPSKEAPKKFPILGIISKNNLGYDGSFQNDSYRQHTTDAPTTHRGWFSEQCTGSHRGCSQ